MPGKISFTASEYKVKENGSWLTSKVGVERTESGVGPVSVKLSNSSSTAPGRGTRDRDYDTPATSQTLTWADSELGVKFMDVTILQDEFIEGSEGINLSITGIVGAEYGLIKTAQLIIVDDDFAVPAHRWTGTELQFQNPDGSWGDLVELKGDRGETGLRGERGEKGDRGETGPQGPQGLSGSVTEWVPIQPPSEWTIVQQPMVKKVADSFIVMKGEILSPPSRSSLPCLIGTLPEKFRPASVVVVSCSRGSSSLSTIKIYPDGKMEVPFVMGENPPSSRQDSFYFGSIAIFGI